MISQAAIFGFVANAIDGEAWYVDNDGVGGADGADLPEHLDHVFRIGIAEAEQIEVTRRPVRIVHLTCDQDGAFEGEPASVRAYAQAVKKPFKRVTRQQ